MKKTISALAALALGAGLALVGAFPASAHTGDMDVSAVCNTATGEYDFTVKLTVSQTGHSGETLWKVGSENFAGTPSNTDGMDRGPVPSSGAGTITLGTFSLPGTTSGKGPWVYAHTTWADGFKKGSDGQLHKALKGDCTPSKTPLDPMVVTPTPPTCTTPGGYGFDTSAPTGADNGYNQYAHGQRIFVDPPLEGPGTYKLIIQGVGAGAPGYEATFPWGTKVTQTVQYITVLPAIGYHANPEGDPSCYVPPTVCSAVGNWFTEGDDVAPVLTIDGLKFQGGSGKAVGYGIPVSGNLQGLPTISYDADASAHFYLRIVIDSSADGGHPYSSLTVTSGSPVTGDSVAYSNKLGQSKTLDEFAALYPNNQIKYVFFHLNSAAPADASVILRSVTSDCGNASWGITQPAGLTGTEESVGDLVCDEPLDGTGTIATWGRDWSQAYIPNETRTGFVLGEKVFGEYYLIDSESVDAEECAPVTPPTEPPATPESPKPTPLTGLPVTGVEDTAPWVLAGLLAIAAGVFFIAAHIRKRG